MATLSDTAVAKHRVELAAHASRAYDLAEFVGDVQAASIDVGKAVAAMIEAVVHHEVKLEETTLIAAQRINQTNGANETAQIWLAWSRTVVAAQPNRTAIKLALNHFLFLLQNSTSVSFAALLDFLPAIAPSFAELRLDGISSIIAMANRCTTPEQCNEALTLIGKCGATGKKVLIAVATLVLAAAGTGELESLRPMELVVNTAGYKDLESFVVNFRPLSEWPNIYGAQCWRPSLSLVLKIARQSCSSAEYVAGQLPRTLATLDDAMKVPYLSSFDDIVNAIGIRVIGFATKTLPEIYKQRGMDRTHTFLAGAIESARRYGPTAGDWFLDQKTVSARNTLQNTAAANATGGTAT